MTGLVVRAAFGTGQALPLLIAPMGASAVLLFGLPASPMAQPWSMLGGNMLSAAAGVLCARLIPDPAAAAGIAVAAAIGVMFAMRCLHPPGGAVAMTAVIGGPAIHDAGFSFVFFPVGLNCLLMLLAAIAYNNLTRRRYPHLPVHDHANTHQTRDATPGDRLGFTTEDLDEVLKEYNQVLDVSRDELESLILQTEMHAYRRRFGEITCADIMSRDVVAVEFGTDMEEAWALLRRHHVKALPVVDRARRVIGIVTVADFMKHADLDLYEGFDAKLRRFIRRTRGTDSDKAEVVGQIMTRQVKTVAEDMHVVELVPLVSEAEMHHIPVVDKERRLAGIVTQSDLIVALYRGRLNDMMTREAGNAKQAVA
ncbi:HPP family protein [Noviherbaspirillum sp. 17J57-3]|uniref:HPP family protein n=2 Tax=Noviherbaspirillum galbum TaxID=2709383 RepID=A0A6B3SMN5_9BURK|nr:HPP family protein [Noviherbaspirillum galbum]